MSCSFNGVPTTFRRPNQWTANDGAWSSLDWGVCGGEWERERKSFLIIIISSKVGGKMKYKRRGNWEEIILIKTQHYSWHFLVSNKY